MSTDRQLPWYRAQIPLKGARCVDVGANVGAISQLFFDEGATVTNEPET